ncbi:cupin domain-containing protein, partial [Vibrio parahaemolyticus]
NMMSVEVHFEEGAIGAMHSHPHEQLTYVLSGEFEFTIGDEKKIVKTGDTMYKEPNIEHGCVCLKAGVLIDTFTPMRKDFV